MGILGCREQWSAVGSSGMQWEAVECSRKQWSAVKSSGVQAEAVECSGMYWGVNAAALQTVGFGQNSDSPCVDMCNSSFASRCGRT